jgi:chromosome segregation ATPase
LKALEASLKASNDELKKHQHLHNQATQLVKKLQHSLKVLPELRDQAVKDLKLRTSLAEQLQTQVDSLTLSLRSCKDSGVEDAKECKINADALTSQLKKVREAHADAVKKLEATKEELRSVSLKLVDCKSEHGNSEAAGTKLKTQLSACQKSQKECKEAGEKSKKALDQCTLTNSEVRRIITDLSVQHSAATTAVVGKLAAANADVKVLKSRLSKCRSRLSASKDKVATQGKVIDTKDKEIVSLKDKLAQANELKNYLSADIATRNKKIAELDGLVKDKQ